MPRLSDSMEEGTILTWLKLVGEEVSVGEGLVEIESDKANMVHESDVAGALVEVLASAGETLPIGAPIARVGDPNASSSDSLPTSSHAAEPSPPLGSAANSSNPPRQEVAAAAGDTAVDDAPPIRRKANADRPADRCGAGNRPGRPGRVRSLRPNRPRRR